MQNRKPPKNAQLCTARIFHPPFARQKEKSANAGSPEVPWPCVVQQVQGVVAPGDQVGQEEEEGGALPGQEAGPPAAGQAGVQE